MRVGLVLLLGAIACGRSPAKAPSPPSPPSPSPSSAKVSPARGPEGGSNTPEGAVPKPEPHAGGSAFHCDTEQRPIALRVVADRTVTTSVLDARGQQTAVISLIETSDVFVLAPIAFEGRRQNRVTITLEQHREGPPAGAFNDLQPWQAALRHGWVTLRQPFVIERHAAEWCIAGRACPKPASKEGQLLSAIAAAADTMMPLEKLQTALDGRTSDGSLSLPFADMAGHVAGDEDSGQVSGRQVGAGIPATFEATSERQRARPVPATKAGKTGAVPQIERVRAVDRITIDGQCRLREMVSIITKAFSLVPGTPGSLLVIQTDRHRLDPL